LPEETTEEIVTTGVELQKAQLLTDEEESIKIMKIDLKEIPEKEKVSIIEEKESIKGPIQKIIKTKKVPKKKDEHVEAIETVKREKMIEL